MAAFVLPLAWGTVAAAASSASVYDDLWGVRTVRGLLIVKVNEASPAEKAGLHLGDILAGFNDKGASDFSSLSDFTAALRSAAQKRDVAVTVWQLDRGSGKYRAGTVRLRVPDSADAKVGLAVMPGVFFREVRPEGAAGRAGAVPWDCVDAVEGESIADRARLDDFDAHVTSLKNNQGNVRVTLVHWKPADSQAEQPMERDREREVVLPVAPR